MLRADYIRLARHISEVLSSFHGDRKTSIIIRTGGDLRDLARYAVAKSKVVHRDCWDDSTSTCPATVTCGSERERIELFTDAFGFVHDPLQHPTSPYTHRAAAAPLPAEPPKRADCKLR